MTQSTETCIKFLEGNIENAIWILSGRGKATEKEWDDALGMMFASPIDYMIKEYDLPIDMTQVRLALLSRMIKRIIKNGGWDEIRLRDRLLKRFSEDKQDAGDTGCV